jgi:hypothetical protein
LYPWIRLIGQSKIVSGSAAFPSLRLEPVVSQVTLRKLSLRTFLFGERFHYTQSAEMGDPASPIAWLIVRVSARFAKVNQRPGVRPLVLYNIGKRACDKEILLNRPQPFPRAYQTVGTRHSRERLGSRLTNERANEISLAESLDVEIRRGGCPRHPRFCATADRSNWRAISMSPFRIAFLPAGLSQECR